MITDKRLASDLDFSKKLYRRMTQILGPYYIVQAPLYDDMKLATDMLSLVSIDNQKRTACRLRHAKYLQYANEITIRQTSMKGGKTEFEKLFVDKLPLDYYLYCFCNEDETEIIKYKLIDWPKFRDAFLNNLSKELLDKAYGAKANWDGTTFIWFNLNYYKDCILEQL